MMEEGEEWDAAGGRKRRRRRSRLARRKARTLTSRVEKNSRGDGRRKPSEEKQEADNPTYRRPGGAVRRVALLEQLPKARRLEGFSGFQ